MTCTLVENLEPRRLLAFGDLDTSLNGVGWTQLQGDTPTVSADIAPDGRVYVAGSDRIERYRPDGRLDPTFGRRGRAFFQLTHRPRPVSVFVNTLPGGKVEASATVFDDSVGYTYYQRFNSDGLVDDSFGVGGLKRIPGEGSLGQIVRARDGAIYGFTINSIDPNNDSFYKTTVTIVKADENYNIDPTFGTGGKITLELPDPPGAQSRQIRDYGQVHQRPDGAFVLTFIEQWNNRQGGRYFPSDHLSVLQLKEDFRIDTNAFDAGFYSPKLSDPSQFLVNGRVQSVVSGDSLYLFVTSGGNYIARRVTVTGGPATLVINRPLSLGGLTDLRVLPNGRLMAIGYTAIAPVIEEDGQMTIGDAVSLQPPRVGGRLIGSDGIPEIVEDRLNIMTPVVRPDGLVLGIGHGIMSRVFTSDTRPMDILNAAQSSITSDNAGRIYLTYRDSATNEFILRRRDETGRWGPPELIDDKPGTGLYQSVAVDQNGQPAIAYYHGPTGSLRLATKLLNGRWQVRTIDNRGNVGRYVQLKCDFLSKKLTLAYQRGRGSLIIATENEDGSFTRHTVDSADGAGRDIGLQINPDTSRPVVSYTNAAGQVKLAEQRSNKTFSATPVTQTTRGADGTAVFLRFASVKNTFTRVPIIAYRDVATQDLVIATRDPSNDRYTFQPFQTPQDDGYNVANGGNFFAGAFMHYDRTAGRPKITYAQKNGYNDSFYDTRLFPRGGPLFSTTSNDARSNLTIAATLGDTLRVRSYGRVGF